MKALTTEEFIKKAKEIHHDKYDYSKTIYKNAHTKEIARNTGCLKHTVQAIAAAK